MLKINEYETKNKDDSKDKWKIYLFEHLKGNLKKRLDEMIETSENKSFYIGLRYEYGYNVPINLKKSFDYYKKGGSANSTDYLSMARLYDIYKSKDKKFEFENTFDKNLEFIYLFKTFAYLPMYFFNTDIKKNIFPLNICYAINSIIKNNNDPQLKLTLSYIDSLQNSGKYNCILSLDDSNLIKGFLEGYFKYVLNEDEKSLDILVSLKYIGNKEAYCRLISIYSYMLYIRNNYDDKKIQIIKSKIYDNFQLLAKYYKVYAQYGLFLYNDLRMFNEALYIFQRGYENNNYECALYYFHAFTKSGDQSIYDKDKFKPKDFVNIFQSLIDAFIYGKIVSLELMFDFFYIMCKRYNLYDRLSNKYMNYLDEIASLCLSFVDKENGKENMKKYNPYIIDNIYHSGNHALSMIYMYGKINIITKDLFKAELCLKEASKINEYTLPYYSNLIYKVRKKLLKSGEQKDEKDLIDLGKELFKLYDKYKTYKHYGNSFYYNFGKLYEKGIGTNKNDKKAFQLYERGCYSLFSLNDSFIIVYKRYLSLKKIQLEKFRIICSLTDNNTPSFSLNFRLSIGKDIKLSVKKEMTIGDIKNILYKKSELQNLEIQIFLFAGGLLKDEKIIKDIKFNNNDVILVVVQPKKQGTI